MKLTILRWILEVEKCGQLTEAANNLYIAQSNLSTAIKNLESEIGYPIFIRTPKGVVPTDEGKDFLEQAKMVIYYSNNMLNNQVEKRYLIGANRQCTFMPEVIAAIINKQRENQKLKIRYREFNNYEILDGVYYGEISIGVPLILEENLKSFLWETTYRKLHYEIVGITPNQVIFSKNHPLADQKVITPEDLAQYPETGFNDFEEKMPVEKLSELCGTIAGYSTVLFDDRNSMLDVISKTNCYHYIATVKKEDLNKFNLIQREVELPDFHHRIFAIVTPGNTKLSPQVKEIIEYIKASIGSYLDTSNLDKQIEDILKSTK